LTTGPLLCEGFCVFFVVGFFGCFVVVFPGHVGLLFLMKQSFGHSFGQAWHCPLPLTSMHKNPTGQFVMLPDVVVRPVGPVGLVGLVGLLWGVVVWLALLVDFDDPALLVDFDDAVVFLVVLPLASTFLFRLPPDFFVVVGAGVVDFPLGGFVVGKGHASPSWACT